MVWHRGKLGLAYPRIRNGGKTGPDLAGIQKGGNPDWISPEYGMGEPRTGLRLDPGMGAQGGVWSLSFVQRCTADPTHTVHEHQIGGGKPFLCIRDDSRPP